MSFNDLISYAGKRVVVTGAASGMGLATIKYLADLGAEISALDRNPVEDGSWDSVEVDLGSKGSIDDAVSKIGGPVNALFNVAGIAGGRGKEKATMMINFFGHRYLTESLLPLMPRGSAVVNVSSLAGYRYFVDKDALAPMLDLRSMDEASSWLDKNEDKFNGYGTSKQLQNLWTAAKCQEFAEEYGIRMNAVGPGSTDTPLLEDFKANAIERTGSDGPVLAAKGFLGRFQHAEEQAAACVFLNSDAATSITGQVLYVDGGRAGAIMSGVLPLPAPRGRD